MIGDVLSVTIGGLITLIAVLGGAVVAGRAWRRWRAVRQARLAAPIRPLLFALFGDQDEAAAAVRALASLDRRRWRAVEDTLIGMLVKVRGETRTSPLRLFHERGVVEEAERDLRRRGAVRRARAAELLGILGHRHALGDLSRLLTDHNPDVRIVAARALGRIGDAAAAEPLLACLAGPPSVPSHVVAHALTRLGAVAHPALTAAIDDPEPLVRAIAIDVLGLTRAVAAAEAVSAALRQDHSAEVRIRAARALGRLGKPSAMPVLVATLAPGEPDAVRAVAARAVGELGGSAAAPALRQLLADPRHRVAHNAAMSLLQLAGAGQAELTEAANDDDPPARDHAREALARAALTPRRETAPLRI